MNDGDQEPIGRTRAVELADRLAAVHPHIDHMRRSNDSDDGFLLHQFLAELAFWLSNLARADQAAMREQWVGQVVRLLDVAYADGDEYTVNAIEVSFFENLLDDEPGEAAVRAALTPRLADGLRRFAAIFLRGDEPHLTP